eukprot:jgi/Psemu1/1417/gm1.1417_g
MVKKETKRDQERQQETDLIAKSKRPAKKEGNQYIGMLYIQMLSLLSAGEFLKYAGTFDEVFKQDKKGVLNLGKMGEGNNLVKNHMYFHLSQYMRLFGPPTGWDSAVSESNHKTEVKAPAKRTQSMTEPNHPTEGGWSAGSKFLIGVMDGLPYMKWDEKNASVPWFPSDALKFCCKVVLLAVGISTLCGSTEHKRYDRYLEIKLLFCAHPSFKKSDSGQVENVWYDWENFQLDLLNGRGLQVFPCQFLCLLHLEGPFPRGSSVSGFKLGHDGYREKGKKHWHASVKQGDLCNKLHLSDYNAIESKAVVVRNHGSHDQSFVLGNCEQWLFNFCETIMAALEQKNIDSIVQDGENPT